MLATVVSPSWKFADGDLVDLIQTGWPVLTGKDMSGSESDLVTATLLQRCAGRDAGAFRKLYDTHASRLYGVALRITRQPALASDAVHDALLQVWQRAARFDAARGAPGAWLTSLVRYRAIDLVRKQGRETNDADLPEQPDDSPGPLEILLATHDGESLHRCIDLLDAAQKRAILLAYVEGFSQSEIAAHLQAPLGTVKSWVRRGLLALKECLPS